MKSLLRLLVVGVMVTFLPGIGLSQAVSIVSSEWIIINGQRWAVYKTIRAGKETHLFRSPGGETLTREEMAARFPAPVIDPELSAKVSRLVPAPWCR